MGFSAFNRFDLRPATVGFPIRVSSRSDFVFAVEPLVELIGIQGLFFGRSDWQGVLLSSGVGVQGVLDFERAYVSVAPLNLQFQYLGFDTSSGSRTLLGFGLNMPIRFSGGLRF